MLRTRTRKEQWQNLVGNGYKELRRSTKRIIPATKQAKILVTLAKTS